MTISLSASVYAGGPDAFPDEEIMVEEAAEDEILVEDTAEEVALAVEDTEARPHWPKIQPRFFPRKMKKKSARSPRFISTECMCLRHIQKLRNTRPSI